MKRPTKSFISRLYHANDKNNHHTFFLNYFSLLLIVNLSENALSCLIPTLISLYISVSSSLLLMLINFSKKYLLQSERARLLRQKQFNDLKCQVVFYSRCMMLLMMCGCHALSNSCLTEVYR